MIVIRYFGVLKETLGLEQEQLDWTGGDCRQLLSQLRARGLDWQAALAPGKVFRLVVNQVIVREDGAIPDGAEVGILPPVTGG
ncbi:MULTISPECIES: MoaD/ThiS family protein [unclassified Paludibacterium]|uniref:MoaD/ThiS family protein n=1 Tax=unclassified Paludibacterium TaxID=2618429 RepID=UPI001C057A77|nr:MoaD/ThiS family protein [Paludibacterium sp. B53371]BEV71227.1 molybdopterin converting factor subunit 1 [Paludibacterium sp. THUN1379]